MKHLALTLALTLISGPALAQDAAARDVVLDCLRDVDNGTSWNQCLNLMFESCDPGAVGTRDHAACLFGLRENWRHDMQLRQTEVLKTVTPEGGATLVDLLSAWPTFVDKKCSTVAAEKEDIGAASARLGCEVSEVVLISSELRSCLDGRSREDYCVHAD